MQAYGTPGSGVPEGNEATRHDLIAPLGQDSAFSMSTTSPPASPLAEPTGWNLVASGYAAVNIPQFEKYATDALNAAALKASHRILDVATGPGTLAFLASPQVARVDAIDFSEDMLRELRRRLEAQPLPNVFAQHGDGQSLPYEAGSFDAVFSMFGLIFFPDRAKGFAELRRVLKPGGLALVSSWQPMTRVPLLVSVFKALAAELPGVPFGDGKGPLSDAQDFSREMGAAGFEVEMREVVHAIEAPSFAAFWADFARSFAPLVLLEHKLGAERFAPLVAGIRARLEAEVGSGALRVEMPAWLGLGR